LLVIHPHDIERIGKQKPSYRYKSFPEIAFLPDRFRLGVEWPTKREVRIATLGCAISAVVSEGGV
jgi:hypothetical protein